MQTRHLLVVLCFGGKGGEIKPVIGLFQILKAWGLNSKIVPLCVLGFSVAGGVAWYFFGDHALAKAVADALLVGCAAMGIFSGIKSTIEFFGDN